MLENTDERDFAQHFLFLLLSFADFGNTNLKSSLIHKMKSLWINASIQNILDSVILLINDLFFPVCAAVSHSKRWWESCHFANLSCDLSRAALQSSQLSLTCHPQRCFKLCCIQSSFNLFFSHYFPKQSLIIIISPFCLCFAGALPYLRPEIT